MSIIRRRYNRRRVFACPVDGWFSTIVSIYQVFPKAAAHVASSVYAGRPRKESIYASASSTSGAPSLSKTLKRSA
jgi:hypothetical protein